MSTEIKLLLAWLVISIAVILFVTRITEGADIIKEPELESCDKWTVNETGNVIVTCTVPAQGWFEFVHPAQAVPARYDHLNKKTILQSPDSRRFIKHVVEESGRTISYEIDREATFYRKCGERWINSFTGEVVSRECCR